MKPRSMFGSRAFWLRQMRQWHWISAAVCLIGMLLFAVTGVTLNHASQIEARPHITLVKGTLPSEIADALRASPGRDKQPLPPALQRWLATTMGVDVGGRDAEWSKEEIYVPLPRAGGDAWVSIETETGDVRYEKTDRGWIAFLNDLHKGRNTGTAWSWFLDIFAAGCVLFCVTGLVLLQLMANGRPSTWPLVGLGLAIPLLLVLLFIH